ncbi:MAG TPA: tetratricopeptide repeat protein [Candidatus Elarobacter sp.]
MRPLGSLVLAAALAALPAAPAWAAPPPAPATPAAADPDFSPAPSADSSAILDAARAKVAAGDTKGAIDGLAAYVGAHPADAAAGRLLGDLYFRVPDYQKAEKVWKAVLVLAPGDRETHSRLGALYAATDRVDASIAEFQQSLPNRNGYAGLIMAHKKAGDLGAYLTKLEYDAQKNPFDVSRWTDLGQARRAMRQFDAAYEAFNRVVGIRPASCAARVDLAYVLVDLKRVDDAIGHLKSCLQNDAYYYPAVVNLGEAYLEKDDPATARPYLDRALSLRPEGNEALVDIGYIYDLQGDWKTAVAYYNRAIRSDPLRPEAYIDLGYDYNQHRFFPLAEAAFLKGISVASDDGRLHYLLAVTYSSQGKISLARSEFSHASASELPEVARAAKRELALLPPV